MSASNWEICPRCLAVAQQAHDEAFQAVIEKYGEIPVEQFNKKRAEVIPVQPEDYRTFREDYEFHGIPNGELVVDYYGECTECKLSLTFKESKTLEFKF
jgi:Fe-S oxidoreductase